MEKQGAIIEEADLGVCAAMKWCAGGAAVRSVREECSSPFLFITFLYKSSDSLFTLTCLPFDKENGFFMY